MTGLGVALVALCAWTIVAVPTALMLGRAVALAELRRPRGIVL